MTSEQLALEIIRSLRHSGYQALLVGGCVRDRLLQLPPKDYDVSTDARPEQIAALFPRAQMVGAHFGVVLVADPAGAQVEVATFRSEGPYSDGRRPDRVHFESNPALDATRRDFTINGLMEDPIAGRVFDYVGGQADLAAHVIRAIGDPATRFAEDHLRMLRAVRFASRLDFTIDSATMTAIQQQAGLIAKISVERVRDELAGILTGGHAKRGFELLDACGLLLHILPEVKAFQGVPQPPEYHPEGDVWTHVLMMLGALGNRASLTLALGALLHDVGKPPTLTFSDRIRFNGHAEVGAEMTKKILTRLKLSNSDIEHVTALVANHMRFKDVQQMRLSTLKRFLSLAHFDEHLELHRLDCLASNGYTDAYNFVRTRLDELKEKELIPPKLVSGRDLIEAGYKPGPAFREALEAAETAQLEGEVQSRVEALAIARSVLERTDR